MVSSPELQKQKQRRVLDLAVRTLDAMKLAAGCMDCGYHAHPAALHFDHRDPQTKRRELGWYDDRSKLQTQTRLTRYIKHVETYCDIRCANCHAVRTVTERHWTVTRGTFVAPTSVTLF